MLKIDLHTHSIISRDGSIRPKDYEKILSSSVLDCIAITDHNEISLAIELQKKLGINKIIVGQEINSNEGEIIGLFLSKRVTPYQSLKKTVSDIRAQGGIVYVPHPFEQVRKGIKNDVLDTIAEYVDIVECANSRAVFQNFSDDAKAWANKNYKSQAGSSDSHRVNALGSTYTIVTKTPTAKNIVELLSNAEIIYNKASILDVIAPKLNRIKHKFRII